MKIIGKKGGKQFKLTQVIGQGTFGRVYKSAPYAVKELNLKVKQEVRTAFENEIKILSSVSHPNVVRLHQVIYERDYVYLVMECCQMDLRDYLRNKNLDEKAALHIFRNLIFGLQNLVGMGFIHRDLKPANILVNSQKEFKLADFGLAKFVSSYDSQLLESFVGSPIYMAPQILNRENYTTKCDIWSMGVILYELLTSTVPWKGSNQQNLLQNIFTKPLNIPSHISQWSKDLLKRMLVVNEQDRITWDQLFKYVLKDKEECVVENRPEVCVPKIEIDDLKVLLELQLSFFFDHEKSRQIANDRTYRFTSEEILRVKKVLKQFNSEAQEIIKTFLIKY